MRIPKIRSTITLHYKEFSESALEDFKAAFEDLGYYLGDVEKDYLGEAGSDTYCLYVAKRKLTKPELLETFSILSEKSENE